MMEWKKKIRSIVLTVVCAVILHAGVSYAHQQLLQQGIAEEVLRFHVLANSDSEQDQAVKLLVRDAVLSWVSGEMEQQETDTALSYAEESGKYGQETNRKTEMEQFLSAHLTEIKKAADDVLLQNGFTYQSTVRIVTCYFPDRTYGDCTFPAGWYKALRISLGEAKGHNWWCVLYPELCFSDCLHAVVEEEQMEKLEAVLTAEEYERLLQQPEKWNITWKWF